MKNLWRIENENITIKWKFHVPIRSMIIFLELHLKPYFVSKIWNLCQNSGFSLIYFFVFHDEQRKLLRILNVDLPTQLQVNGKLVRLLSFEQKK